MSVYVCVCTYTGWRKRHWALEALCWKSNVYVRGQNVLKFELLQLLRHVGLLYFHHFVHLKLSRWINALEFSEVIIYVKI
jgi:hypothetical protein